MWLCYSLFSWPKHALTPKKSFNCAAKTATTSQVASRCQGRFKTDAIISFFLDSVVFGGFKGTIAAFPKSSSATQAAALTLQDFRRLQLLSIAALWGLQLSCRYADSWRHFAFLELSALILCTWLHLVFGPLLNRASRCSNIIIFGFC